MTFHRKLFAFFYRDFVNDTSYKLSFVMQMFGVFFSSITFFFLSEMFGENVSSYLDPYGGNYFAFVIIGIAFYNYLQVSLQSFSTKIREAQLTGTMEALLLTQTSVYMIIFSSSIYSFFWTSFRVLLLLFFGVFVFGMDISNANYLAAVVILFLTISSFIGIGIISGGFIMVFKRGNPLNWIINSLSLLLGGVYYPTSVLPEWLQKLAYVFPITHSLEGMRNSLLNGAGFMEVLPTILALTAFTIIVLPVSLWVFGLAVKKAERDGSLAHY